MIGAAPSLFYVKVLKLLFLFLYLYFILQVLQKLRGFESFLSKSKYLPGWKVGIKAVQVSSVSDVACTVHYIMIM